MPLSFVRPELGGAKRHGCKTHILGERSRRSVKGTPAPHRVLAGEGLSADMQCCGDATRSIDSDSDNQ